MPQSDGKNTNLDEPRTFGCKVEGDNLPAFANMFQEAIAQHLRTSSDKLISKLEHMSCRPENLVETSLYKLWHEMCGTRQPASRAGLKRTSTLTFATRIQLPSRIKRFYGFCFCAPNGVCYPLGVGGWSHPSKREKLQATKKLKKRGAYPKSGARCVRRSRT
jgi:hypothetical protein